MADVTLPQLGETVTEGTITQWFKQVGDSVAADEALFEVSTDKVDTEVPSPVAGTLTEIRVQEGETVEVGTVIAVVGDGAGAAAPAAEEAPAEQPAAEEAAPDDDLRNLGGFYAAAPLFGLLFLLPALSLAGVVILLVSARLHVRGQAVDGY